MTINEPVKLVVYQPTVTFLYFSVSGQTTEVVFLTGQHEDLRTLTREQRAVARALLQVAIKNIDEEPRSDSEL